MYEAKALPSVLLFKPSTIFLNKNFVTEKYIIDVKNLTEDQGLIRNAKNKTQC